MPQRFRKYGLTMLLSINLASCGGGDEIIASCQDMTMSDESLVCIDAAASDRELIRNMCSVARGQWVRDSRCDSTDAIAGCKKDSGTILWMFRSPRLSSVRDVEKACGGGELLAPGSL